MSISIKVQNWVLCVEEREESVYHSFVHKMSAEQLLIKTNNVRVVKELTLTYKWDERIFSRVVAFNTSSIARFVCMCDMPFYLKTLMQKPAMLLQCHLKYTY